MSEESKQGAPGGASPSDLRPEVFDRVSAIAGECRHRGTDGVCEACVDAALAALKAELESCRSRLSTAEKALRAIADFAETRAAAEHRRLKTTVPGEWVSSWDAVAFDARAALSGSIIVDAPTAPSGSEIASDSSALEKALGALRRLLVAVTTNPGALETADAVNAARDALSGGAHIDVPKAPREEL